MKIGDSIRIPRKNPNNELFSNRFPVIKNNLDSTEKKKEYDNFYVYFNYDNGSGKISSTHHVSLDAVGLPGFQFIQDELAYGTQAHHSNMDTYNHCSAGDLMQSAVIIASFIYNASMMDGKSLQNILTLMK